MSDFIENQGLPLLAHLMKRLSDEFVQGCDQWLPTVGVIAPARTSSTLRLLNSQGPQTITEIAGAIHQSYPLVITWVRQLEELDLIESGSDLSDKRKRIISITTAGRNQVALIKQADQTLECAYRELFDEAQTELLRPLWTIEHAMRKMSFAERLEKAASTTTSAFDKS